MQTIALYTYMCVVLCKNKWVMAQFTFFFLFDCSFHLKCTPSTGPLHTIAAKKKKRNDKQTDVPHIERGIIAYMMKKTISWLWMMMNIWMDIQIWWKYHVLLFWKMQLHHVRAKHNTQTKNHTHRTVYYARKSSEKKTRIKHKTAKSTSPSQCKQNPTCTQ